VYLDLLSTDNVRKEARVSVVDKALCYKQEGHGFETPLSKLIFLFNLPIPSGRTRPSG
jgi:hypothetical protein